MRDPVRTCAVENSGSGRRGGGTGAEAIDEERKIAPQDDVGSEAVGSDRLILIHQMADESFEGKLALCFGALVEGCEYLAGFQQRYEFMKQVGGNHLDMAEKLLFLEGAENGQAVRGADIDRVGTGFAAQQCYGLPVCIFRPLMGLDDRQKSEMGGEHGEACRETTQLLGVIEGGQLACDGGHAGGRLEFVGEQLGGECTTGVGVDRDAADAAAVRGIAGNAEHRSAQGGNAAHDISEVARPERDEENAVAVFGRSAFQSSAIARAEARIVDEVERELGAKCFLCGATDALTEGIEESGDLTGKHGGNTQAAVKLQRAGCDIRLVAKLFGHAQDTRFGARADAAAAMQSAVDGANGSAESLCDVADTGGFAVPVGAFHVRCVEIPDTSVAHAERRMMDFAEQYGISRVADVNVHISGISNFTTGWRKNWVALQAGRA
jgi:hypothetical protein